MIIRKLNLASSSKAQFRRARRLNKSTISTYRLFMEREVVRGLLPIENIRIYQNPNSTESYCCLDKNIYIIRYCTMDFPDLDVFQNLDVEMGYLIHECGHAIYTEYDLNDPCELEKISKRYPDIPFDAICGLDNMFEDVHIEYRLSTEIIGTGNYLLATRENFIRTMDEDLDEVEYIGLFTLLYFRFNREDLFNTLIDDPKINKFGYTREEIDPLIRIPKSTKESHELTEETLRVMHSEEFEEYKQNTEFEKLLRKLMNLLGNALTESMMKKIMDSAKDMDGIDGNDHETGQSGDRYGRRSHSKSRVKPGSDEDFNRKTLPKDLDEDNESISRQSTNHERENSTEESKKTKKEESKNGPTTEQCAKLPEYGGQVSNEPEYIPDDLETSPFGTNEVTEGIINQEVKWVKQKVEDNDVKIYEDIARKVAPQAAILRSIFEKYNVGGWKTHTQQETGKIDRRFLHRVPLDDQRVFKTMEKRVNAPLDVIMLIDESGSMGGVKYQKAREVAILIHEALIKIPEINYWCYGHTTEYWDGCLLTIYHEGKVTDMREKYRLSRIHAYSGNCDGRAILEAASRVRNRIEPNRKVLMILISDGLPSESCPGISASEFAKRAAIEVQNKMGYDFIHIGIECSNHELYKHSIDYVDNDKLVYVIGQLVTEHIQKNRAKI